MQELRIPLLSPLVKEVTVLSERQKVMRHKLYYLRDRCAPANTHLHSVGPGAAVWQPSPKLTLLPLNVRPLYSYVRPLSFSISF